MTVSPGKIYQNELGKCLLVALDKRADSFAVELCFGACIVCKYH